MTRSQRGTTLPERNAPKRLTTLLRNSINFPLKTLLDDTGLNTGIVRFFNTRGKVTTVQIEEKT